MTRFDRYLLRETLAPLLFSLALYSTLAVVSVTLPRLQWVVGAPVKDLAYWLLLQVPAALVQTLPVALVLAVLLVFGRLAASSELLAAQAGGISLLRIGAAFVFLSALFAAAALGVNEWVLPVTNAKVGSLYWPLTTAGQSGLWRLAAKNIPLNGYTLYFERVDPETDELSGVRIEAWQGQRGTFVLAERARFGVDGLELYEYSSSTLDFGALSGADQESATDTLRAFVLRYTESQRPDQPLVLTTSESVDELITHYSGGGFEDSRSLRATLQDASDSSLSLQERRQATVLFHRKLAEPLANLTLLLVAIPLSLLYARSRSVAFGLSLVVTLAWYVLLTAGQLLAQSGALPVWLGLWLGNIVLAVLGLYLLLARTRLR
ncbi:MAG TPA: LptF/LptG family permease [Chloroflexota bacterium]|nr:LptF/LptG family permease [Chloroflexota bacterium]